MKLKIHTDSLDPLHTYQKDYNDDDIGIIVRENQIVSKWTLSSHQQEICGSRDRTDFVINIFYGLFIFGSALTLLILYYPSPGLHRSAVFIPPELEGVFWDREGRLDLEQFTKKYSSQAYLNNAQDAMIQADQFYIDVYDQEYPSQRVIPEEFLDEWVAYIMITKKLYNPYEMLYRRSIFVHNKYQIMDAQARNPETVFELNYKFMDRTDSELKQMLMQAMPRMISPSKPFGTPPSEKLTATQRPFPKTVDWVEKGKVTHVKDQGQCGSCWAFATVASIESRFAIRHAKVPPDLSEQELVDCNKKNDGCKGGDVEWAFFFVADEGLVSSSSYPYTATDGNECRLKKINGTRVFIQDVDVISGVELLPSVANDGPIVIVMGVTKELFSYKSGTFTPDCWIHAVTVVGYDQDRDYFWIVKNSWGTHWGEGGYFRLQIGNNCIRECWAPIINLPRPNVTTTSRPAVAN